MTASYDLVIIGAGIVGLSTARELLLRHPHLKVALVEKEGDSAQHQTSHNSGVIHSGVYYKPGSAKASLCVQGVQLLQAYCDVKGIPYRRTGKVIVALNEDESYQLDGLQERGRQNGLQQVEKISQQALKDLEPHVQGHSALHIPSTGIVDYAEVARAFQADVKHSGGTFHFDFRVQSIQSSSDEFVLESQNQELIRAKYLMSCSGLYSDRIAKLGGGSGRPKIVPFRGDYLMLKKEKHHLIRGNVYPVPNPKFPFLGVHFTPTMKGELLLGPNAVLAFSREGYRFRDIRFSDIWESLTYSGFIRLAQKHFADGVKEMVRDLSQRIFVSTLQQYVPELRSDDCLPGPSGVRAQALDEDGSLVDDFIFDTSVPKALFVVNAPSPAATASLAIAKCIADKAQERFDLGKERN